jgi:medium-chain acyl-[acyl-carrier-protein] hydrolase
VPTRQGLLQVGGTATDGRALVCIPQAGAGSAAFSSWLPAVTDVSALWAACLPGREGRILEDPLESVAAMADELLEPVRELPARQIVLFGHCSGALVAYELAHRLSGEHARGRTLRLVVSSQRSPAALPRAPQPSVSQLSLAQLIQRLREMGGTDEEILSNGNLMELLAPAIRADLYAVEQYAHDASRPRLCIPITAMGGRADVITPSAELAKWRDLTSGEFTVQLYDDGRSYLADRQGLVLSFLRSLVAAEPD